MKNFNFRVVYSILICAVLAVSCGDDPKPADVYSVTVTNDGNGTAKADPSTAGQGTTITLTASPSGGYVFGKWTVVSGGVEITDATANPATFEMPAENVEINAEFVKDTDAEKFMITVTDDGNGTATATVNGDTVAETEPGTEVTLTALPADGYVFDKWSVESGGVELDDTAATPATFIMPAENIEVKAWFKPDETGPVNYIQIDGGDKQEILSSTYAVVEGEGYAFAVSPMGLTDRPADKMERRFSIFIPVELMDKDINVATSDLTGQKWTSLILKLDKAFLNRLIFSNNYQTTGTLKITRGEEDSFIIDFTDFIFSDGTKVSMHYEGKIDKKEEYSSLMHYTAVMATYDIQIGDEIINTRTVGYIQNQTYEEEGAIISNIWGYIDSPYAYYDIYLIDPDGGIFTEATYVGTDYSYTNLEFDGNFETDNMADFFMEENSGTITFSKTATTMTMTFTDVPMYFDEEMILNGTITCDVAAPISAAVPAGRIPEKMKKLKK